MNNLFFYLLVMALTAYLLRMVPILLFRKEVTNPILKRFFLYIPYAILAAMTFPAIFSSAGALAPSLCGLGIALILAFLGQSLTVVSFSAAVVSFIVSLF